MPSKQKAKRPRVNTMQLVSIALLVLLVISLLVGLLFALLR